MAKYSDDYFLIIFALLSVLFPAVYPLGLPGYPRTPQWRSKDEPVMALSFPETPLDTTFWPLFRLQKVEKVIFRRTLTIILRKFFLDNSQIPAP